MNRTPSTIATSPSAFMRAGPFCWQNERTVARVAVARATYGVARYGLGRGPLVAKGIKSQSMPRIITAS
jgi:hypothetical protein